ncbi:MAG: hypothetical protein ACOC41_07030, partial [Chitinivibrionales bacterium]
MRLHTLTASLLAATLLIGCGEPKIEENVVKTHPNGNKWIVDYYQGNVTNVVRKTIYFPSVKVL